MTKRIKLTSRDIDDLEARAIELLRRRHECWEVVRPVYVTWLGKWALRMRKLSNGQISHRRRLELRLEAVEESLQAAYATLAHKTTVNR